MLLFVYYLWFIRLYVWLIRLLNWFTRWLDWLNRWLTSIIAWLVIILFVFSFTKLILIITIIGKHLFFRSLLILLTFLFRGNNWIIR